MNSAKTTSILAPPYLFWLCVAAVSLSLAGFLGSAVISLYTIVRGLGSRKFFDGPVRDEDTFWLRLGDIEQYQQWQRSWQKRVLWVLIAGTALFSLALVISVVGNLIRLLSAVS